MNASNSKVRRVNLVDIEQAKMMLSVIVGRVINGHASTYINACLHGSPGLGKSSIVRQVAEQYGMNIADLRLSAMQESDVLGIPYTFEGVMKFSTPEWWPTDDKPMILFLDELMSAPPTVQTAAYRLILDRSIQNGSVLPDNVMIVAAGNLKEDRTGARDLLPAAANRFGLHLFIDKDTAAETFLNYAVEKGLNRSLVGYLSWKKESVYGKIGDDAAFATPRSWEYVSEHMDTPDFVGNSVLMNIAVAGAVGSEESMSLAGYMENEDKLPDWNRVRTEDEYEYRIPFGDLGLEYAVAVGVAFELLDALRDGLNDHVARLSKILSQIGTDMKVVAFKTMKRDVQTAIKILSNPHLKVQWADVSHRVQTQK